MWLTGNQLEGAFLIGQTSTTTFDHCIFDRDDSGVVRESPKLDALVSIPKSADGYVKISGPASRTILNSPFIFYLGSIPAPMGGLSKLAILRLDENKFTGAP